MPDADEQSPQTRTSLVADLAAIGVRPGMTLITHSALSRIGWVIGGAGTVIAALVDALGTDGTLVMPTFSGNLSDPAGWTNPPVPEAWHDAIRANMPAFDPARTQTRNMGQVPELFRTWPGVYRSRHPIMSLAAWGRGAEALVAEHSLPWARLFVDRSARGRGVGRAILHAIEQAAAEEDVATLLLETGIKSFEAIQLYNSLGYRQCGRFGGYGPDPLSVFMVKHRT